MQHRKRIIFLIESEDLNKKMPQPLELDLENISWKITVELSHALKGIIPINQIHVAQWKCSIVRGQEN